MCVVCMWVPEINQHLRFHLCMPFKCSLTVSVSVCVCVCEREKELMTDGQRVREVCV